MGSVKQFQPKTYYISSAQRTKLFYRTCELYDREKMIWYQNLFYLFKNARMVWLQKEIWSKVKILKNFEKQTNKTSTKNKKQTKQPKTKQLEPLRTVE